jgi:hypothetical protein
MFCSCSSTSKQNTPKVSQQTLKNTEFVKSGALALAPPLIELDSILFESSCKVTIRQGYQNARIYYTVDNTNPDTNSLRYDGPIILKQSAVIKALAYHSDFKNSEQIKVDVFKLKSNSNIASIQIETPVSEAYPGGGGSSLMDLQKGSLAFRANAAWSGFQNEQIDILVQFKQPTKVKDITLSALKDHASWIFLPSSIEILINDVVAGNQIIPVAIEGEASALIYLKVGLDKVEKTKALRLRIKTSGGIPEWHPGKGTMPWLFIDEIFIK